jgi:hypothetical protein
VTDDIAAIQERKRRLRSIRVLNMQVEELRGDFATMRDTMNRFVGATEGMAGSIKLGVRILAALTALVALLLVVEIPEARGFVIALIKRVGS